MKDFMDFLNEAAQEDLEARRLDEFPRIVARAQAANRKAANEDPMMFAGLVQQRPLQAQAVPLPKEEQQEDIGFWSVFLQGVLLGAAMATLLMIGVL